MTAKKHSVRIQGGADGIPTVEAEFGRVTVILGANGAGKSRLMKALLACTPLTQRSWPVVVEGNRKFNLPYQVTPQLDPEKAMLDHHRGMKSGEQAQRLVQAILCLGRVDREAKIKGTDEVYEWLESGQRGDPPARHPSLVQGFFRSFNQVFPYLKLQESGDTHHIRCLRDGAEYNPDQLSDGEKMVYALLLDVATTAHSDPDSLFLVDEPELHLHPNLACRLWDVIEGMVPMSRFVYATHCLSFAMRASVDQVIVLRRLGPAMTLPHVRDVPREELREFLGVIPGIVSAAASLVVEGDADASFDGLFFPWVLGRPDVAVVGVNGAENVIAAAKGLGVWQHIAPGAVIHGVIDRDYRGSKRLAELRKAGCTVLRYHEAESYLCHPDLVTALALAIGTAQSPPKAADVVEIIKGQLEATKLRVAAKRAFERSFVRLQASATRQALDACKDEAAMLELVAKVARHEEDKAEVHVGAEVVKRFAEEELAGCNKAIKAADPGAMLELVEGKALLRKLAMRIGCADQAAVARGAAKHLKVEDYPHLTELREQLLAGLGDKRDE